MARGDLIQFRRGTAAEWGTANPRLAPGEVGYSTDANEIRAGDGRRSRADREPIGDVTEAAVQGAVTRYLDENPIPGVSTEYVEDLLFAHETAPTPHSAYDVDIPSLSLLFKNGLI